MDTALCFQQLLIGTHKIFPIMETDEPENITKKCVDFNTDTDEGRDKGSLLKSLYRIPSSHHQTNPMGRAQLQ